MDDVQHSQDNVLSDEMLLAFLPQTLTASVCAFGGLFSAYGGTVGEVIVGVSRSVISLLYIYQKTLR